MVVHKNHIAAHEARLDALLTLLVCTNIAEIPANMLSKFLHAESAAFKMHEESHDVKWQCLAFQCDVDDLQDGQLLIDLDMEVYFGALSAIFEQERAAQNMKPPTRMPEAPAEAIVTFIKRALNMSRHVEW